MDYSNKYVELAKQLQENNESVESIIRQLKQAGASQAVTTKAFIFGLGYELTEADRLIVSSEVWADNYDAVMMVREMFFETLADGADQVEELEDGTVRIRVDLTKRNFGEDIQLRKIEPGQSEDEE
jgi:hypothetical protein